MTRTKEEADRLLQTGRNNFTQKRYQESLDSFRAAQLIYHELGDKYGEAQALNGVGVASSAYRDINGIGLDESLGIYKLAIDVSAEIEPVGEEEIVELAILKARLLNNIGMLYDEFAAYYEALKHYDEALSTLLEIKGKGLPYDTKFELELGNILNNQGFALSSLNFLTESLISYAKALHYRRSSNDQEGEKITLSNIRSVGVQFSQDGSYFGRYSGGGSLGGP